MIPMQVLAMAPPPNLSGGHQQSPLFLFGWLLMWAVPIAIICYRIAKQKGRREILAAVLGLIPVVNLFALLYVALASNRRIEDKLDDILAFLKSSSGGEVPKQQIAEPRH